MKSWNKANAQRQHFKNRMLERYGLVINNDCYKAIIRAIQDNTRQEVVINGHKLSLIASWRKAQTNRVSVWLLLFGGIEEGIPVAYDKSRGELITTHPELLESHKNK